MILASTPATLPDLRRQARDLLNEFDAADGLASYYTLHHDTARTALYVYRSHAGAVDGFLTRCQTGFDLFRPLITMRVRGANGAYAPLLEAGLVAGRPYLMVVPPALAERVARHLTITELVYNRAVVAPSRWRASTGARPSLLRYTSGWNRKGVGAAGDARL